MLVLIFMIGTPIFQVVSYGLFQYFKPKWIRYILPISLLFCLIQFGLFYYSYETIPKTKVPCGYGIVLFLYGFLQPVLVFSIHVFYILIKSFWELITSFQKNYTHSKKP